MEKHEGSSLVSKGPCPDCASSDALCLYDDGHSHCFSCDTTTQTGKAAAKSPKRELGLVTGGTYAPLRARRLSEDTCKKFGYQLGAYNGEACQIANYRDKAGEVVAQKIRLAGKNFKFLGDTKKALLFGQHLWSAGKMLVVTEGEIDCLSVSQLQGNKWPVVSIRNGAGGAEKDFKNNLEFLEGFEKVVIMFDGDEPGQKAAQACAGLLTPGKAAIASLPLKDPNECLVEGKGKAVIDAIWQAKPWRPDGLISIDEVIEEARKPAEHGRSWPWEPLTKLTFGRRPTELYALGAGVGSGKTDLFTACIAHDILTYPEPVGVIYLETPPAVATKRIAGKIAGKAFHVPNGAWEQPELDEALEQLRGRVILYNHFGSIEWKTIKSLIRYMAHGFGVHSVYLDHLTALTSHAEDERRELDAIMAELAGLCQELGLMIHFISHLATPDGKPHEEGGRVMSKHFRGSRSIMQWSHFMFGLERNQQSEHLEERNTSTLRVLKDRNTGQALGATMSLHYDKDTGSLKCEDDASDGF